MATGCVGSDRLTTIPPAETSSTVGSAETGWFGRLLGALGTGKAMPSTLATITWHSLTAAGGPRRSPGRAVEEPWRDPATVRWRRPARPLGAVMR